MSHYNFQAEQHVKTKIIKSLGTDRIFQLLDDSDTRVIMKTLGLLRNLLSNTLHIENIMSEYSSQIMKAVNMININDVISISNYFIIIYHYRFR